MEAILDHRGPVVSAYLTSHLALFQRNQGHLEYLVKWKGYSDEDTTWEPLEHLYVLYIFSVGPFSLPSTESRTRARSCTNISTKPVSHQRFQGSEDVQGSILWRAPPIPFLLVRERGLKKTTRTTKDQSEFVRREARINGILPKEAGRTISI